MFEITRRNPTTTTPLRNLMSWFDDEPFLRMATQPFDTEGALAVDVEETDDELIVTASVPGFKRNEVNVEVHDGILTIEAQHTEEEETKNKRFHRRERRFGSMTRSISLPGNLAEDKTTAALTDGVLTVHVPRAEIAKPRKIAIK